MPILTANVVCEILPEGAPLLLRPFLWSIFDAVSRRMVAPRLRTHMEYVRTPVACVPQSYSDGLLTLGREATKSERWRVLCWWLRAYRSGFYDDIPPGVVC